MSEENETEPLLLPPEESEHFQNKQVSLLSIIFRCVLIPTLVVIGIMVPTNLAVFPDEGKADLACWTCVAVNCAYALMGIVVICCFHRKRCIGTSESSGHCPSNTLVLACLAFAGTSCLSTSLDFICKFIEIVQQHSGNRSHLTHLTLGVIQQVFLMVFIVLQGQFFFRNVRLTIEYNLSLSWVLLSTLVGCNIAIWYFTVGNEVQLLRSLRNQTTEVQFSIFTGSVYNALRLLYPFHIEYCVLSTLMAFAMMANIFHRAVAARTRSNFTAAGLDRKLCVIFLVLAIPTLSAGAVILIRIQDLKYDSIKECFYYVLLALYAVGIGAAAVLLHNLRGDRSLRPAMSDFATDRVLLWLGAAALLAVNYETIWQFFYPTNSGDNHNSNDTMTTIAANYSSVNKETVSIVQMISSGVNMMQCVLQVITLEYLFLCKFSNRAEHSQQYHSDGGALVKGFTVLNFLIMLNISEWLLSIVCFQFFSSQPSNLSVMLTPLQIFFRFHSATGIHEFKKYLCT